MTGAPNRDMSAVTDPYTPEELAKTRVICERFPDLAANHQTLRLLNMIAVRDETIEQLHQSLDAADECYDSLHAAKSRNMRAAITAALSIPPDTGGDGFTEGANSMRESFRTVLLVLDPPPEDQS